MKGKLLLPILLMIVFALTRWPGLLPWNFSAVYGLMFCAGVYFPKRIVWWLPLTTLFITDMLLNWYYHVHYNTPIFSPELLGNYVAYTWRWCGWGGDSPRRPRSFPWYAAGCSARFCFIWSATRFRGS